VVNSGSSSVKADLLNSDTGERVGEARAQRLGTQAATLHVGGSAVELDGTEHAHALAAAIPALIALLPAGVSLAGVGHRVVHGGEAFREPTRLDEAVISTIQDLSSLGIKLVIDPSLNVAHESALRLIYKILLKGLLCLTEHGTIKDLIFGFV
jgi:acetate kinase